MRGARIAPREALPRIAAALTVAVFCSLYAVAPATGATLPTSVTIDFSQPGQGPFDQSYFQVDGVSFTEGSFVGYIQGDDALVGPAAASVKKGFMSIAASFAPAGQGTADYTLAALSSSGRVIASNTLRVTQDTGDPDTGPFGYATVELGPLPRRASAFRLSNTFVRSSYPHITLIEFGVSQVTLLR